MNFLKCQSGSCAAVNGGKENFQISSKRCSFVEYERKSYGFGQHEGE